MLFYALAAIVLGTLTFFELRRGATLDRNRMLNVVNIGVRFAAIFALARFIPTLAAYSLFDLRDLPWVVQFATFFLLVDLGEYLFHRAQHSIPALWALHSLHHSDPDMNATTTDRHHWADHFIKFVTIYPAVGVLITPVASVAFIYMLIGLWNYVAHAALPWNFGRWSWLINSPAYHRRHHSALPEHYNSNFAALLPIWDVLSGTYRRPDSWPATGIERKPSGFIDLAIWPLRYERGKAAAGTVKPLSEV